MAVVVHVTHEAVHKVGGIGAVLAGLLTSAPYRAAVERTILVGPLFDRQRRDPLGPDGTVLYDNWNGTWADDVGPALYAVEVRHGVRVVYGRRRFASPDGAVAEPEVVLVDVEGSVPRGLGAFKFQLFQHFGIPSDRYESHWEYEQYVRLAEPAFEAVAALATARPLCLIAHEFMGLPTALRGLLAGDPGVVTLFYAHEVATARRLVEERPGGDLAFYNAMRAGARAGLYVEDLFGPQDAFFKHALVRQAWRCDGILAVGDAVVEELRFLGPEFARRGIDRVYNGVPVTAALTPKERGAARGHLARVVEGLLGWSPDLVFTHVGRLVRSKGLWRDLVVLHRLEAALADSRRSAALLVLATEAGPRPAASVARMRADYDWPVVHREGDPDLTPGELAFDLQVRAFNARSRHVKALFVNQFGFDSLSTGGAVPEGVGLTDLRRGSDAEFGLSLYEPFGIAQIETLAYGAVSVVSDACGCVGFLRQVAGAGGPAVHVVGEYTRLDGVGPARAAATDPAALAALDADRRRRREVACSGEVAAALAAALPGNERQRTTLLAAGHAAAAAMSWDRVAREQLLPALRRAAQR